MGIFVTAVILSVKLLRQGQWFSYSFVAFGDSLTDNGNIWRLTNGSIPSTAFYYNGRWSNGPTWVEVMSNQLGTTVEDYAYGGATTDNNIIPSNLTITDDQGKKNHVPSLADQVKEYLPNVSTTLHRFQTTYFIWIGGNDYQQILNNYNTSTVTPQILIDSLKQSVNLLEGAGAHKILILNIPPLDRTPRYINRNGSDMEHVKSMISEHNQRLVEMTRNYTRQSASLVVKVFDVYNLTMEVIGDPRSFGFTNVDDPCVVIDGDGKREVSRCVNADEYLFWDEIHPTAKAHQLLADQLVKYLKSLDGYCLYVRNLSIAAAVPVNQQNNTNFNDTSDFESIELTEFNLGVANYTNNKSNIFFAVSFIGVYINYSDYESDNLEGTTTKVDIIASGFNDSTKEYPYKIHEYPVPTNGNCNSVGNVPQMKQNCPEGDLSGKWGGLPGMNSDENDVEVISYSDPYLEWVGNNSILGKSFVIYSPDNNTRLACANITEPDILEYDDVTYVETS
ncbi:14154_t:CDS:2 [Ambispora leptoticha]|uniref:14154_t:CDS:1 n=1 Tax=Ambispora leptoticha TaxID=144679 RepID=A0A9N9C749_9GLOM|nr:14154_t:CDS:2 [Ambispora leptoticha]